MKYLAAIFIAIILSFSLVGSVSAHQSGCHRWHSCPSDSGSYTCGDTGYDTYCGGSNSYSYTPNYTLLGAASGVSQASKDRVEIIDTAEIDGNTKGYKDGYAKAYQSNLADSYDICNQKFTFTSASTNDYRTAFYRAYQNACIKNYSPTYSSAYDKSYQRGWRDRVAEERSSNNSGNLAWIFLAIACFCVWWIVSVAKPKR